MTEKFNMPTQTSTGIPNIANVIMICALVQRTIIEQILLEKNYIGLLNMKETERQNTKSITGRQLLNNVRESIGILREIMESQDKKLDSEAL